MRILTHTVSPEEEGRMVKGILRGSLQLSYTLLKSLKWRENAILLNGQSVHVNAIVHAGDVVSVALSERTPREDLYCENTAVPNIVYEDEDLLVLNKPAGVAMHPKADDAAAPSLAAMLTGYLGEGSVPHFVSRLDKGTSGLLIAAKSGYVHDRLRCALHSSELRREYRAVAVGLVTPPCGVIDAPIGYLPLHKTPGQQLSARLLATGEELDTRANWITGNYLDYAFVSLGPDPVLPDADDTVIAVEAKK